jgi:hypothetical protein
VERLRRAGQLLGILNTVGINAISYTDATPTVPELWPKLAGALNSASNARKRVPDAFWSHGQRWFWAASQLDSNNRPFFLPASNGPQNALGVQDGSYNQDGPVTNVLAVPWYLDLNIPTNINDEPGPDRRDRHARSHPVRGRPERPRAQGDPQRLARRPLPGLRVRRRDVRPLPGRDVGHHRHRN